MHLRNLLFVIGIAIFLLVLFSFNIDFSVMFRVKNPIFIILAAVVYLIGIFIASLRAGFFIKITNKRNLDFSLKNTKDFFSVELINKLAYYILPARINVPIKALLISKAFGVSKGDSIAITALEYAIDLGIMFVLGFILFSIFFQKLFYQITLFNLFITLVVIILLAILFFLVPSSFFERIVKSVSKIKNAFVKKIFFLITKTILKVRTVWPRLLLDWSQIPILILSVAGIIITAMASELIFLAYGIYVPVLWVIAVGAVSVLVGGISQIPGGIGSREITIIALFVFLGLQKDVVLSVAVFLRILSLLPIILGYIALVGFRKKFGLNVFRGL